MESEIAELYAQHTAETGQIFERQAVDYVFEQTQGQPWLVNAIARECVEKITKKILQNESNRAESLRQLLSYMDKLGADAGWLVIFDKDAGKSWDEKIYMTAAAEGKRVTVVGC